MRAGLAWLEQPLGTASSARTGYLQIFIDAHECLQILTNLTVGVVAANSDEVTGWYYMRALGARAATCAGPT